MKTKLYRFYNMTASRHGEIFALCDKHRKNQKVPDNCSLETIADKSKIQCIKCYVRVKDVPLAIPDK